jgi:hypothetical protein
MTAKEFAPLERELMSKLPGFTMKRALMFSSPIGDVLQGINFEGSGFDKTSFTVTAFLLPLCVPTNNLYFNFGIRIRRKEKGDRWNIEMPYLIEELGDAFSRQVTPFFSRSNSLSGFVKVAEGFPIGNPHTPKAIAFALARAGHNEKAINILDQLIAQLDFKVNWQKEIDAIARTLKSLLETNPSAAQRQLTVWETETAKNLGLDEYRKSHLRPHS